MPVSQTDLDAVLRHCRTLLDVADELSSITTARADAATGALQRWNGDYADQFRTRMDHESLDLRARDRQLRADADSWARIWAQALNEENHRRRQDAVQAERDRRGFGEQFVDIFHGDDSERQVRAYHNAPVPTAASRYQATGWLETF
jgi:hypothetical protein